MINEETEPLRAAARRHRLGFLWAMRATIVVAIGALSVAVIWPTAIGAALSTVAGHGLDAPQIWQSVALTAITLATLGLYSATFAAAAQVSGALLRSDAARASRRALTLSRRLWVVLVWSILGNTLSVLVATAEAAPGERVLSIGLGATQISMAIAALIASFLAHTLALTAALWRDQAEII